MNRYLCRGWTVLVTCLLLTSRAQSQQTPAPENWMNVFAGRASTIQVPDRVGSGLISWSVSVERAVIARGELAANRKGDDADRVAVQVTFPELKAGVIVPGSLSLDVRAADGARSTLGVPLQIFSPDVTSNRQQWLKSLDIVLFDPSKKTSQVLTDAGVPYRSSDGPVLRSGSGLVIYGERTEPALVDTVWQSAIEAAASGRRVIVLSSAGMSLPVDDVLSPRQGQCTSVSLRRPDIIREFDKRLNAVDWPAPARMVTSSLHWTCRADVPRIESQADSTGWPWLDLRFNNGGRLVVVGFGLIESWEVTPTPRYLFLKLLEDVMAEKTDLGGSKNAEK